jgi:hypothetical protein
VADPDHGDLPSSSSQYRVGDHAIAVWIGRQVPLVLDIFKKKD